MKGMQAGLPKMLRLLRAERALTLEEAAKRTGVTRETLGLLERGKRHPHTPTLAKIANGYGVSLEDLLDLEEGRGAHGKSTSPVDPGLPERYVEGYEEPKARPEAISWANLLNQQAKRVEHTLSRDDHSLEDVYLDMGATIDTHILFLRYRDRLLEKSSITMLKEILQAAENRINAARKAAREAYHLRYQQALREAEQGAGNVYQLREQRRQLEERERVLDAQDVG